MTPGTSSEDKQQSQNKQSESNQKWSETRNKNECNGFLSSVDILQSSEIHDLIQEIEFNLKHLIVNAFARY